MPRFARQRSPEAPQCSPHCHFRQKPLPSLDVLNGFKLLITSLAWIREALNYSWHKYDGISGCITIATPTGEIVSINF